MKAFDLLLSRIPFGICCSILAWAYCENASIVLQYYIFAAKSYWRAFFLTLLLHALWLPAVCCLCVAYFRGPGSIASDYNNEDQDYDPIHNNSSSDKAEDDIILDEDDLPLDRLAAKASPYVGLMSKEQRQDILAPEQSSMTVKANGEKRYCRKCQRTKPDRAHHCRVCGTCRPKMDHHCGVLGVCVGYANYKAFVLFLIYTTLFSVFSTYNALSTLIDFVSAVPDGFELAPIGWALLMMLGGAIGLVLGGFAIFHLYLVSQNKTTIENMESTRIKVDASSDNSYRLTSEQRRRMRKMNSRYHLFDNGWKSNFHDVFASRYGSLGYLLPIDAPPARLSGTFKINEKHIERIHQLTEEMKL